MSRILIGAGIVALVGLVACGEKVAEAPKAAAGGTSAPAATAPATGAPGSGPAAGGGPPPPPVGVVQVKAEAASLTTELPGRIEASRVAQIRARVAGIVQKRLFQEGSDVKAGQVLYELDPAPFRAALESAQAALQRSEATLMQNKAQADRLKPLVAVNAVSQQEYTNAVAAQKQSEADIASSRAAIKTARINLDYTKITAPIAGRIGRTLVTEGALVGQGEATQMATSRNR
jgi:membrane fusion protein, multidrug efflux system